MSKLTIFERQIIESKLRTKQSHRNIAKALGRDRRVIDREISRNKPIGRSYIAAIAHRLATEREIKRNRPKLTKYQNQNLKKYIVNQLVKDWSPEQIAGVLKKQPPKELRGKTICTETIYQFIYEGEGYYDHLYAHLRRGRKTRQKQWARKPRKEPIPDRISIHERPTEILSKTTIGHWESDTVEGKKMTKGNLSVQYERKLMLARLHKVTKKQLLKQSKLLEKALIHCLCHFLKPSPLTMVARRQHTII